MDNSKSISELGEEYEAYAKDIEQQISECRTKLKYLQGQPKHDCIVKIVYLQDMLHDLRFTAKHLKNYYNNEEKTLC